MLKNSYLIAATLLCVATPSYAGLFGSKPKPAPQPQQPAKPKLSQAQEMVNETPKGRHYRKCYWTNSYDLAQDCNGSFTCQGFQLVGHDGTYGDEPIVRFDAETKYLDDEMIPKEKRRFESYVRLLVESTDVCREVDVSSFQINGLDVIRKGGEDGSADHGHFED